MATDISAKAEHEFVDDWHELDVLLADVDIDTLDDEELENLIDQRRAERAAANNTRRR